MPSCRNCGAYTKYSNGLCKQCYYGRNQRQGGSFLGSFFEGETGDALERTPLSVLVIIFLLVVGVFSFIGNWFNNRLVSILMIVLGMFWVYKKIQRRGK